MRKVAQVLLVIGPARRSLPSQPNSIAMKPIISSILLLCSLPVWAQKDSLLPPPIDLETLPSNDGSLTRVEEHPQFPGGEQALVDYMKQNLLYPADMQKARIGGTVQVAFTITAKGDLENVRVQRGITNGEALNVEALRVVNAMPRWEPAHVKGVPVPMDYVLPVKFSVSDQL